MNFQNGRKILTSLTFGCPTHQAVSAIEDARIEFELQTCLCFSDWTDESDNIEMIFGNG